ncbi:conserved hypothetical protein [Desulfovibrionales bacterium]
MIQALKVVLSIDTEEEGLFSGEYLRTPSGVRNVIELRRLEFLFKEFNIPLTLLVSYHVAKDPYCCEVLMRWKVELGAEIGAHMHPWNTPPFEDLAWPEPIPTDCLPASLLRAKLESLLAVIEDNLGVQPCSFRMGRWDFGQQMRQLLPQYGISVDSSLVPYRHIVGRADNFLMPWDPFWLEVGDKKGRLYEVPLTVLPLFAWMPRRLHALAQRLPGLYGERLLASFQAWGAVGPQPVWYPQTSMRWAAWQHIRRGGILFSMFLHSSELMPGASPNVPDEAAAIRLVGKIRSFIAWLANTYVVQGISLAETLPV